MALSRTVVFATATALVVVACGGAKHDDTTPGAAAAKRGGTLTVPWSSDVDSIDPGQTYYAGGYMAANVPQRPPMAYEPGRGTPREDLAAAAPVVAEDGLTVTLELRGGVKFS